MSERLPEFIAPLQLAATGQLLKGQLPLSRMRRLSPGLLNTQGIVDVELVFGLDTQRRCYARGFISARLELICQRCLEPMSLDIDVQPCLALVTSQAQAEQLPEQYEPLLVEAVLMSLAVIIEDELILAMPDIASHGVNQEGIECLPASTLTDPEQHPFAGLEQWKQKSN